MKEGEVLKFLTEETHLDGANLNFQMQQSPQREKWWHLCRKSKENLGEGSGSLCHWHHENSTDVTVISSRSTEQQAVLKFAAATGATPVAHCAVPGTFTKKIQAGFQEQRLLGLLIPGLTSSLSYVNLLTFALSNRLNSVLYGHCHSLQFNKEAHSVGLMWWMPAGKFCPCVTSSPVSTHRRSCLISTSTQTRKRLKRKSRLPLKTLWPRRNFGVNGQF